MNWDDLQLKKELAEEAARFAELVTIRYESTVQNDSKYILQDN